MEENKGWGFTDEAAEEDLFKITDYIGGLADFIQKCNTPMTISIQGSWGTGKTSIMNIIKINLKKRLPLRFTQFGLIHGSFLNLIWKMN